LVIVAAAAAGPLAVSANRADAATYSGIVIDAKTGKVLYSERADANAFPASLTKMMTLYLTFEALESGKLTKKSRVPFSAHAASMQPSKLGVKAGGSISVEQAILALVTKSANDVAAAMAEKLGGTESKFAEMMTSKARDLGMSKTRFRNASGLPNSSQVTTARDMATLGIALREHFPQYYGYFATRSFTYGKARMGNHNRLLGQVKGMDGIKTGYTRASGFNLVSSVERDGRSIVAVVMGGRTGKSRNQQMAKIIAAYLPKASRGDDRMLVARPGETETVVVASAKFPVLPAKGPVPTFRDDVLSVADNRIASAHASPDPVRTASFDADAIERKLMQIAARDMPVPERSPATHSTDRFMTAAVSEPEPVAASSLGFAPEPAPRGAEAALSQIPDGWQIQLGAAPSEDGARRLLDQARAKAPKLLADAIVYTETVEKGAETLYRARFAGFSSKTEARNACGELKRKKFACLTVSN